MGLPIVDFLKEQASESLQHAQQAGETEKGIEIKSIIEGGETVHEFLSSSESHYSRDLLMLYQYFLDLFY